MSTVELGGVVIRVDDLEDTPATVFDRARTLEGNAWCLCRSQRPRLVIRCRDGRWHLARWPGDRDAHANGCHYRGVEPQLSGASHYTDAITETENGNRLRVAVPLVSLSAATNRKPRKARRTPAAATTSRNAMTLGGLLHYLWETAGLNTWKPGNRDRWGALARRLDTAADACTINGDSAALYVVPGWHPSRQQHLADRFATFRQHLSVRQRGLIIADLKAITKAPYGHQLVLRALPRDNQIYIVSEVLASLRKSYPTAIASIEDDHARCVGIWLIDQTRSGNLRALDAALMATTLEGIPAESSHELTMARHIIQAGVPFLVPLRYDTTSAVFPDFVLTATTPATYVEVYGIHGNTAYDKRKAEKQAYYREVGIPVIEWDTTEDEALPRLPSR